MALDGNIDKTVKAPDDAGLSSLNLNSVSDKPGAKPVQIADDGVFNRTRGQGQQPQGGRAHPFSSVGDTYKEVTGKDAPANPTPVPNFTDHAAAQTPMLQNLGNQQQALDAAALSNRVQGNAIAVGFGDNAKHSQALNTDWDFINEKNGISGTAGRVGGVAIGAFAMGVYAHPRLQDQWRADRRDALPVLDKNTAEVQKLHEETEKELAAAKADVSRAREAVVLQEKSTFLKEYIHGNRNARLADLSEFNKSHPAAFSPAERDSMKLMADADNKLAAANGALNAGSELKGFKGFYERGKSGLWTGMAFVAGSIGVNYALKEASHLLPEKYHPETDRVFTQTTQESFFQGLIGAAPIRSLGTRAAIGAGAWLAGREQKMNWGEAIVATAGVMGATVVAGLTVPGLKAELPKTLGKEALEFTKTPVGKALVAEAAAFGVGRLVHMIPGLGNEVPELQNTSTEAWNSMKTDSEKMTGSSYKDAVSSFDELGGKWRGVLADYQRDIVGSKDDPHGIYAGNLALAHGDQPLNNWQTVIINGRTGMALSQAVGDTVLKAGLTGDSKKDLLNSYHQQSSDEKPITDTTIIAPNQGDLDLTSRAAKNYMTALALADVTMENMKKAQTDGTDTSGNAITDAQIKAVADEKAKMVKEMSENIFRSAPGAEAHDIKDIVESSDGVIVSADKYKLTDYANHDRTAYDHMVSALSDKAYAARDGWLPGQANGPNADISKEYVAKIFRDAAVMRLAYINAELETQTANGLAPNAQSVTNMIEYMQNSDLGRQQDPGHANRDTKSIITAAWQLDPNNPDMKAIMAEYDRLGQRLLKFNGQYIVDHNGQKPSQNPIANPFGIPDPANAH